MMMVMITIMKIVVMIYFSCSQCCLPQFPGLLNFPYDTILSAGAFLVTDAFLHACSVISCFFAETTFLDFFQHPFLTHCWASQRPHGSSITIAAKDFFSNFPFFGNRRKATSNLTLTEHVFNSFFEKGWPPLQSVCDSWRHLLVPSKTCLQRALSQVSHCALFRLFHSIKNKTTLFKAC